MRIATPDLVTNSYFPALAAEELGVYREEGLDAHVQLLPSLEAVNALRDGAVDFVAGGAHTTLLAFPRWQGAKLVVTLSQGTPWLLVVHADLPARRGDIGAVKGLRVGAARGPDRAFLRLVAEVGIDPARTTSRLVRCPARSSPVPRSALSPPMRSSAASSMRFGPTRLAARSPCGAVSARSSPMSGVVTAAAGRPPHVRRALDDRGADRP